MRGGNLVNFAAKEHFVRGRVRLEAVAPARHKIQMNVRPKCESRNDQPAMSQEKRMMISAHAAPIHGFAHELTMTLAMTDVRNALSAASTSGTD